MTSWWRQFWKEIFPWRAALLLGLVYIIQNALLQSMDVVIRGINPELLRPLLIIALLFGWLFARSGFKGWIAVPLHFVLGLVLTIARVGRLDLALRDLGLEGLKYLIYRVREGEFPSPEAIQQVLVQLSQRLNEILATLWIWVSDLQSGFTVYNQAVILVIWGLVLWALSLWITWSIRRQYRPLWGMLPGGLLLTTLLSYTPGHRDLIIYTLGAGFSLLGLTFYQQKESEWIAKGVSYPTINRQEITWSVLGTSLLVMIFAAVIPSIRVDALSDPIQEWLWEQDEGEDTLLRTLGVEYDPGVSSFSVERVAGLPRSHLIGSGPELAKRVVMVARFPPGTAEEGDLPRAARYWRAYTYDQYTGSGWKSGPTVEEVYQPGEPLGEYSQSYFHLFTQEIRISNKIRGALYAPGRVETVDREFQVSWRTTADDPREVEDQGELVFEDIFAIAIDNIVYQVQTAVPVPGADQLRASSLDYPAWIEDRYLELPESVPDRVLELAGDVIAGQPTAYDQVKAIESYLRNFPYTLDLPAPVSARDVADVFLFELQKGYCDYYATTMVVLARAAGLPSRLAIGYVEGRYDADDDRYLITEADAHSWPEIYFSDLGWIPFEPTSGRGLIDEDAEPLAVPPELDQPPPRFPEEQAGQPTWGIGPWMYFALGPLSLVFLLWYALFLDMKILERQRPQRVLSRIYDRLYWVGYRLPLGLRGPATPHEFQRAFIRRLDVISKTSWRKQAFRDVREKLDQITGYYVFSQYGPGQPGGKAKEKALQDWKDLRLRLLLMLVVEHGDAFQERVRKLIDRIINRQVDDNGDEDEESSRDIKPAGK